MFGRIYGEKVTNNVAEITAIIRAMKAIPSGHDVEIVTDSLWSMNSLEMKYKSKKNLGLIADGREEMFRLGWFNQEPSEESPGTLQFRHVKGHKGDICNEMADVLAGEPWESIPDAKTWNGMRLYVIACVEMSEVPDRKLDNVVIAPAGWSEQIKFV